MPELPEVETVRRGLQPVMEGATITRVEQRRPDLRFPFPPRFGERLTGRRVVSVGRRAKYLIIHLDRDPVLICHLGMSGLVPHRGRRRDAQRPEASTTQRSKDAAHDHVIFHVENETERARIVFNDPRRFGFMLFSDNAHLDTHPMLAELGLEPTGNALDGVALTAMLRARQAPLKAALLDQRNIAGLGNIYVCEALWRARLSPRRSAGSIASAAGRPPTARAVRLAEAVRATIAEAIAAGGSSLRDYIHADGSLGYFQHSFSVYGREGEPCPRLDCSGVIARIVQAGRSTFYCPVCQR